MGENRSTLKSSRPNSDIKVLYPLVSRLARRGYDTKKISQVAGITRSAVTRTLRETGFRERLIDQEKYQTLISLSLELGATKNALKQYLKVRGHSLQVMMSNNYVTSQQAALLREHYSARGQPEDYQGWLTSEQVAREFGVGLSTLRGWLRGRWESSPVKEVRVVRVRSLIGPGNRLFHPWDILEALKAHRIKRSNRRVRKS